MDENDTIHQLTDMGNRPNISGAGESSLRDLPITRSSLKSEAGILLDFPISIIKGENAQHPLNKFKTLTNSLI